jgi:hypothetical protein
MPDRDVSQEAAEQVNKVTGSAPALGEDLFRTPRLRQQFTQTKEQTMRYDKEEALKEDIFRAWKDWDLEVEEIDAKNAAKKRVEAAIDKYKEEINSKGARWSFYIRFGPEYADWRREND